MNCCDDFGQCKQGHGCPARSTALREHEKKAAYDYGVACRTAKNCEDIKKAFQAYLLNAKNV